MTKFLCLSLTLERENDYEYFHSPNKIRSRLRHHPVTKFATARRFTRSSKTTIREEGFRVTRDSPVLSAPPFNSTQRIIRNARQTHFQTRT